MTIAILIFNIITLVLVFFVILFVVANRLKIDELLEKLEKMMKNDE